MVAAFGAAVEGGLLSRQRAVRILHVLPHGRALGGTERTVLDLLSSHQLRHLEQRLTFVQPGSAPSFSAAGVIPHRRLGTSMRAIRAWGPDIVHGWLLQGNLLAAAMKLLVPGARVVTSERNVGHAMTPLKRVLERMAAMAEDVATANSSAVRDAAVARVPSRGGRMRIIPPGVRPLPRPDAIRACDAVVVGRLHPVKDHPTALRAWRSVVTQRPDATLSFVGDGPERAALGDLARSLGVADRVSFHGDTEPAPHLYGARIFVLPSRAEGFSRALIEALGAGLPAVCTDVGGVDELPATAVRRVPVGDHEAMGRAILDLLGDEEGRARAAAAARATAERYAPETCHATYADLYAQVAG
jgi:glycosyltransferase involved in cell wall biosynthesis